MKKLLALAALLALPLAAEAATIRATGSFQDNSDNETGFTVEKKIGSGAYETLQTLPANTTSFVDNGLAQGVTVCYRVLAFNELGSSAPSAEACATTPSSPLPPSAVQVIVTIVP